MDIKVTPLSFSRLEEARCLFRFKRVVLDRLKTPKNEFAAAGGLFHLVVDLYSAELARNPQRKTMVVSDPNLMAETFDHVWEQRPVEYAGLDEGWYDNLRALSVGFSHGAAVGPDFVMSEARIAVDADWKVVPWNSPEVFYRFVIDRVTLRGGTVGIKDWKTSWKADSQAEAERSPQMAGYAMAGFILQPEATTVEATLVFPRPRIERTVTFSRADIDSIKARILRQSARIERAKAMKEFPAIAGSQCEFCPVWHECPIKDQVIPNRAPDTDAEVQALLGMWAVYKKGADLIAGRIKAWVKMRGAVQHEGLEALYATSNTINYEVATLRDALQALGVDPWSMASWDRKALKKLAKKSHEVRGALEAIGQPSPKQAWKIRKAGDDGDDEEEG